jgi:hypothetical protein
MLRPWNAVRLDPARLPRGGHVESYFLKLNDPSGARALWIKATLLARAGQGAEAEAWAIAFDRGQGNRAAKEVIPLTRAPWAEQPEARFSDQRLDLKVASLRMKELSCAGSVTSGSVRLSWNLSWACREAPLVPFPGDRFYSGPFPRSKLVSPAPDARFSGWYEVDGARHEVDSWPGMQGHNWGTGHTHRYAWVHGNLFDDPDFVLEGLTGRVKLGPAVAPPITILCVRHRGVRYDWNRVIDWPRARGEFAPGRWSFGARSDLGEIEGEVTASPQDVVGLVYENPAGPPAFCLNSKLARAEIRFAPRGRAPRRLTSQAVALEIGTTDPGHGVPIVLGATPR